MQRLIPMTIGELSQRVSRSVDTIKRWEDHGLLTCARDVRGRRVYDETHVELGLRLATLALVAQRTSARLTSLAAAEPKQLRFELARGFELAAK